MILVNKENFYIATMHKAHNAATSPRNTVYTDFRICLVLEGEAVWEIDERGWKIEAGDIILLSCSQKRQFTAFGKNGFRLCVFSLKRDVFSNLQHFIFFLDCIKRRKHVLKKAPLAQILYEVYDSVLEQQPLCYEFASAKLTEFFIKLEKELEYDYQSREKIDREMLDVLDYIDMHLSGDVSLRTLAAKTGLTESAFSRRFSKLNGISFKQYVIARKIDHATVLLQTENWKVTEIARACGFESVSGFYDTFKRQTGTTPGQYQQTEWEEKT